MTYKITDASTASYLAVPATGQRDLVTHALAETDLASSLSRTDILAISLC